MVHRFWGSYPGNPLYHSEWFAALASELFGPEKCCINSGALYVYDREGLTRLLATRAGMLEADNLPLDPDRFVAHIAAVWFQPNHPAYAVIAAAFGEIA